MRPPAPPPPSLRRRLVVAGAILALFGALAAWNAVNQRSADPQEVFLFGADRWAPGAPGVVRVVVRDSRTQAPVPRAKIQATLGKARVQGVTRPDGAAELTLPCPPTERATLSVRVRSPLGTDKVDREIRVAPSFRIQLSTDKPLYQPSQTIHLRALATEAFSARPQSGELTLEVEDPNGNRVFKQALRAGEFGIAAADFALADEVTLGRYRVRAAMGDATAERTVEVGRYALPKFKIELRPDRGFYGPGDRFRADLEARYLFGEPVAGAGVRVELSTTADGRRKPIQQLAARTDAAGRATIETWLPTLGGDAPIRIDAEVTDGAGHVEKKAVDRAVSAQPLRLEIFAEAGRYISGVPDQKMYVVTSYADGTPASAMIDVYNWATPYLTDDAGLAIVAMPSPSVRVTAKDKQGRTVTREAHFLWHDGRVQADFLLRTDRAAYRAGDRIQVSALSSADGTLYLDVVKDGQTVLTRSLRIGRGRGELGIDLPAGLSGLVRIVGYRIAQDGTVLRDARMVAVDLPEQLRIRPTLRKPVFEPGEDIEVDLEVLDLQGRPAPSALGVSVVDEAVFALPAPKSTVPPATAAPPALHPLAMTLFGTKQVQLHRSTKNFNDGALAVLGGAAALGWLAGMITFARQGWKGLFGLFCLIGLLALLFAIAVPGLLSSQRASNERNRRAPEPEAPPPAPPGDLTAPRIREFFPETLYWNPEVITDARGRASLKFPGADSITTWRLALNAVAKDGRLGAADHPVKVFQPFFIDLELPLALTQGDEIRLPVAVHNHLGQPQSLTISFEAESGVELLDAKEKTLDVLPGQATKVRFHVRAREFGRHQLRVKAVGATHSDAVRRTIEVFPDGREVAVGESDRVRGASRLTVVIPPEALPGATRLWARLFPSAFSEIVTGLEGLVRMPYG